MKKIICLLFCFIVVFRLLAEDAYVNKSFHLKSSLSLPNLVFKTLLEAQSKFLHVVSGVETEDLSKLKKITELQFKVNSFGFCFSPLLYKDDKGYQQCLSFYFGKLNYSKVFGKLISNSLAGKSYVGNISIGNNPHLSLSKTALACDFGFEFRLKGFALNYVAAKAKKVNVFDHAIFLDYTAKNVGDGTHNVLASSYLAFSASEIKPKTNKTEYNTVFGSSFMYVNDYIGMSGDFATSKNTRGNYAFSGAFSIQNFWDVFTIKLGTSVNTKNFIGWKNTIPKESIAFYIQPRFSYNLFAFESFYRLERSGLHRKENQCNGKEKLEHTGAFRVELKNKKFRFLNSLSYAKKIFSLESLLAIYLTNVDWFKSVEIKGLCDFSSKELNPYVVEKYAAQLKFSFLPLKHCSLYFNFNFSQNNKVKRKMLNGKLLPVIEWQAYDLQTEAKLRYDLKRKKSTNSFTLGILGYNKKPYYNIQLAYSVKF